MPTEAVLHRLSSRKMTESLMMQIILHCAPVLKNVKMSSMFTVPAAYLKFVRSVFKNTGIKVRCLCQVRPGWFVRGGLFLIDGGCLRCRLRNGFLPGRFCGRIV